MLSSLRPTTPTCANFERAYQAELRWAPSIFSKDAKPWCQSLASPLPPQPTHPAGLVSCWTAADSTSESHEHSVLRSSSVVQVWPMPHPAPFHRYPSSPTCVDSSRWPNTSEVSIHRDRSHMPRPEALDAQGLNAAESHCRWGSLHWLDLGLNERSLGIGKAVLCAQLLINFRASCAPVNV